MASFMTHEDVLLVGEFITIVGNEPEATHLEAPTATEAFGHNAIKTTVSAMDGMSGAKRD